MIPLLLLLGLVFGRWWRSALLVAVIGWPLLLLVTDTTRSAGVLVGAAGLAIVNVGIGIAVTQALLRMYGRTKTRPDYTTPHA